MDPQRPFPPTSAAWDPPVENEVGAGFVDKP
jgi:hypothetical protein